MIEVNNISKSYNEVLAVDQVSFSINKGEVLGLLGHNGAGKTTIMKMLTGFLSPDTGTINISNMSVSTNTLDIQKIIGYLPENCPVWSEMSIIEYLDFQLSLKNIYGENKKKLINDAIDRTNIRDRVFDSISSLSRGYRQRVGVAQAIMHNPEVIILDEPTNGLDPTQILSMRNLVKELSTSSTVILSTHVLQEVEAVCDRVIIIGNGKKLWDNPIKMQENSHQILFVTNSSISKLLDSQIKFDESSNKDRIETKIELTDFSINPLIKKIIDNKIEIFAIERNVENLSTIFDNVNSL
jgi:ABC-2 type transport system ATP-binding protein